jgi:hypothetical protein
MIPLTGHAASYEKKQIRNKQVSMLRAAELNPPRHPGINVAQ